MSTFDPLAQLLGEQGVPYQPEVGHTMKSSPNYVFEFPIQSPQYCTTRKDVSALEQCDYWQMFKDHWCEHNPSVTIYCKPDEWVEVGAWVYKHWNTIGGMTFFPEDNGNYKLAPYEEIDSEKYEQLVNAMPDVNFDDLDQYETSDETEGSRELACAGGACEL